MVTYKLPDYHIAQAENTPRAVPGPGALRVYAPESSRVLDSERLFIAQPDGRLSAWQGVRWADPAPVLLRDRIVEAFMRDGRSTSVITDSTPMSADMELRSTLRAFQLEYRGTEAIAAVRLDVQLVDPAKRTAIASRRFEAIQATGSKREADVVSAFGVATDILAGQIVEWAVQVGAARLRVAPELASNHAPTASSISTD
ncbi:MULTISPECIES: ABC-type transport auxiliary lipoprotein family protein [Gammaproteobacteria]|nr:MULTISPECIES: ABC-type transport auxiliary lipoprotein family protein [Gammaproteobacteria]MCA4062061.1 ABC-type transport auxiliary lipoprotein family protein [Pseudomonas aeruginosa]MDS9454548.1 ABC-type transport auxiliary lipoprotein family protein [Pseudomonas aeruginosa]MDS9587506.1 ABC-type transport auxiliary lipoprotein family protein [Pseudomonas aeruginosa]MDS9618430.1 ABC-type transport auxiliary lipoprotein family protein [Pseudomonas aeruginosa]MDS9732551.1 ABC-type transport 